jgi:hypothetical protein
MTAYDGYLINLGSSFFNSTIEFGRIKELDGYVIDLGTSFFTSTKQFNEVKGLDGFELTLGSNFYYSLLTKQPGAGPSPVVIYYRLAAVDTGVGRRSWDSTAINFSQAPSPVGSWNTNTLTILYSWQ